jgi:hypothetical protein
VLLILQAHDSKNCQEFYKYVKRSADRFIDLGFGETVEITKFDVERYLLRSTLVYDYLSGSNWVVAPF